MDMEDVLRQFGVDATFVLVQRGPMAERYVMRLGRGGRVKEVLELRDDISRVAGSKGVLITSPPDLHYLGDVAIDVPRADRQMFKWNEYPAISLVNELENDLDIVLGLGFDDEPLIADLAKIPHLLVAGSTGSGKSVFINAALCCLIDGNGPRDLQFVLIDPRRVELSIYAGIPHLALPIATDTHSARDALSFILAEMDNRYTLLDDAGARDFDQYRADGHKLPFLVIAINELSDLMMSARQEVESAIVRITQLGHAVGIHLVVATQRPSGDVISDLVLTSMPSRIAFTVRSATESNVVLGDSGAEFLTGKGDGLFVHQDSSTPIRFQGLSIDEDIVGQYTRVWIKAAEREKTLSEPEAGSDAGLDRTSGG